MARESLRKRVEHRARDRCEYCFAPQRLTGYTFHLEHIISIKMGGTDAFENRALACASCNLGKGERISAADPVSGNVVSLFNPRTQDWREHFRLEADGRRIEGRTASGRATVSALSMNKDTLCEARSLWVSSGWLWP